MIIVGYSRQFTPPPDASSSYTATAVNSASQTTYTFSSQSIGTADATRRVVVAVSCQAQAAGTSCSSLTIGGTGATKLMETGGGSEAAYTAIFMLAVSSGTTATIVATMTNAPYRLGIGVYRVLNLSSDTPTNTYSATGTGNPLSVSADISAGGTGIGVVGMSNYAAAGTYTWAGLTERYDATISGAVTHSGASDDFATAQTGLTVSTTYTQTPGQSGSLSVVALR